MSSRRGTRVFLSALTGVTISLLASHPAVAGSTEDSVAGCYRRTYDAAHLRTHPGQKTKTVLLSLRTEPQAEGQAGALVARLAMYWQQAPLVGVATCSPEQGMTASPGGVATYPDGTTSFRCTLSTGPGLTEDVGGIVVTASSDRRSARLYLGHVLALRQGVSGERIVVSTTLGDDHRFSLRKASPDACRVLSRDLARG